MKLIVFDLEMNQPSRKIIQIGAVEVRLPQGDIVPFFSEIVNPGETPNGFISRLTGITTEDVENARPITEAVSDFWDKVRNCPEPVRLGAWGSDCKKLKRDTKKLGLSVPDFTGYDLQQLCTFHSVIEGTEVRGTGLTRIADRLGIDFEGRHHNAYDDALATAKIFLTCLGEIEALLG